MRLKVEIKLQIISFIGVGRGVQNVKCSND